MAAVWEFTNLTFDQSVYSDGTIVPHLDADVILDGQKVGRINVHLHKHLGRDKIPDVSFGFTGMVDSKAIAKALGLAA